jgi:acyl-lipid omega-6 desaturase (Delta-12 desaturase)
MKRMKTATLEKAPTAKPLSESTTVATAPRKGPALIAATRPFAREQRSRSWFHLWTTLAVLSALLVGAALAPWWPLQLALSMLGAGVMVRGFIIYHDFMHGAILRGSTLAGTILRIYGLVFLTPPRHWRNTHNFHHANVATIEGSSVGSFPVMTVDMYRNATKLQRVHYRIARHPMTYLLAYITVFLVSNVLEPFIRSPRKSWQCGLSVLVHGALIAGLWLLGGFGTAFFAFILPYAIAAALGAYLFYAQHNFPGMRVLSAEEWSIPEASLESSSLMRLNPVLDWMTGSIGYHHVHHLNATIPFYRLKEAMNAIPELQNPVVTNLAPWSMWRCLRLKLWHEETARMLSFREARRLNAA